MGDAPRDFLPPRRFLRAEHFCEIVENQDVAGVRAARPQRTHGDREVTDASGSDRLNLPGDHSHAQGSAHQIMYDAGRIRSEESFERLRLTAAYPKHPRNGTVHSKNGPSGIQRNNSRGNVLQYGFHELAPALEFLHRLLEVTGELIDLRAAVAQLRGHVVKGAHQDS